MEPRDLKGRTAISYARWSSGRQTEGDSLRRQTENAERFAARYGLNLDRQLVDGAVSAYTGANLEASLGKFIADVEAGTIPSDTVLLLENLDRLTRINPVKAVPVLLSLLDTGLTLVTLHDERVHTLSAYSDNTMHLMMSLMSMQANHEYSAKLSARNRAEWNNRANRARQGRVKMSKVPFWIDQQTQELNDRADTARAVFEMTKKGLGQRKIAAILNEQGVPSPSGITWSKSSVQDTVDNVAAYGSLKIKGEEVKGYYPTIVSENEWLAIQQRNKARHRNPQAGNTVNLFPGLLRCGHCDSPMALSNANHPNRTYRYLRCNGAALKRTPCKAPNWRYDHFEEEFLSRLGLLAVPASNAPQVDNAVELEDAVKALETRQANVLAGVAEAGDAVTRKVLLDQSAALSKEIETRQEELIQLRSNIARQQEAAAHAFDLEQAQAEILRLSREDRAEAQRLIGNLVERIDIETDGTGRATPRTTRAFTLALRTGRTYTAVIDPEMVSGEP